MELWTSGVKNSSNKQLWFSIFGIHQLLNNQTANPIFKTASNISNFSIFDTPHGTVNIRWNKTVQTNNSVFLSVVSTNYWTTKVPTLFLKPLAIFQTFLSLISPMELWTSGETKQFKQTTLFFYLWHPPTIEQPNCQPYFQKPVEACFLIVEYHTFALILEREVSPPGLYLRFSCPRPPWLQATGKFALPTACWSKLVIGSPPPHPPEWQTTSGTFLPSARSQRSATCACRPVPRFTKRHFIWTGRE